VTIDANGMTASALFRDTDPPEYAAIARAVRSAKVTGVFLSSEQEWGKAKTGAWHHLYVAVPLEARFRATTIRTADQAAAEKLEEFGIVRRALGEYTLPTLNEALRVLSSNSLYRSEKVLGPVQWLRDLADAMHKTGKAPARNILWRSVAAAPAGFCHPRSSMAGTLLDDIAAGKSFDDVSASFSRKMNPGQYQRPQAAPTAGGIAVAEKLVKELGIERSLLRRMATVEEIQALWRPTPPAASESGTAGGVFSHIVAKGEKAPPTLKIPAQTMTWTKFASTVLPNATRIAASTPFGKGSFCGITTAVNPEAPILFQWGHPFSTYVYLYGSPAAVWSLKPGAWVDVTAITHRPMTWNGAKSDLGNGIVVCLEGARETNKGGLCLFPETLRADLRPIRSVIEAYSATAELAGKAEGSACGLSFNEGDGQAPLKLRVFSGSAFLDYTIDRWD